MNKKTLFTILAIIILPLLAFFGITKNQNNSVIAEVSGKPQIIKFSSTMCAECKEVEKTLKDIFPKYQDKITMTEIIVDSRNDMKNKLIKKYNVQMVPTLILLNSDGTQSARIESSIPAEEMDKYIRGLH